jgi:hypothetical protein
MSKSHHGDPHGLLGTFGWMINTAASDPDHGLLAGVQVVDGDLTVPLIR